MSNFSRNCAAWPSGLILKQLSAAQIVTIFYWTAQMARLLSLAATFLGILAERYNKSWQYNPLCGITDICYLVIYLQIIEVLLIRVYPSQC